MAKQSKRKSKTEQNPNEEFEEARRRDALALAELLYDIYQEQKRKEVKDGAN